MGARSVIAVYIGIYTACTEYPGVAPCCSGPGTGVCCCTFLLIVVITGCIAISLDRAMPVSIRVDVSGLCPPFTLFFSMVGRTIVIIVTQTIVDALPQASTRKPFCFFEGQGAVATKSAGNKGETDNP
jgi:hypothetical protein